MVIPTYLLNEKICKVKHAKALGYCAPGMRAFCRAHGLDYLRFVREGMAPKELLSTKDSMAIKIIKKAMQERAKNE